MKNQFLFLTGFILMNIFFACEKDMDFEEVTSEEDVDVIETEKGENHDAVEDYIWDAADLVFIELNGNSITVKGEGASASGSVLTISSSGTYSLSGNLSDGQLIVDTEDEEIVRLILNTVDIQCSYNAAIYIQNAEKTMIVLADGTENVVSDGSAYYSGEEDANSCIFSKDPITIYGNGQLQVNGNYNDGISSNDGLIITSGTIKINAEDDGIRGKDYLIIKNGVITINAEGDGLLSDKEEDADKGYILIQDGVFDITAGGDGIQAETDVFVYDGNMTITSGGGSDDYDSNAKSAKGIKAAANLIIHAGTLSIDAAEDALYSDTDLRIYGGTVYLAAGDDGIHAEADVFMENGFIEITKSYEGIESFEGNITINSGEIYITSSDDGINLAAGGDGTGGAGSTDHIISINGGYVLVNASGDGIDANANFTAAGGTVIISGSTENFNSPIDCDGTFLINGGLFIATGTSQMAKAPNSSSAQYAVMVNFSATNQAGTIVHIQNAEGDNLLTFEPLKSYQTVIFSSSALTNGISYNVYYGGSSSGALSDGLYTGGVYTSGSLYTSFTISDIVTTVD